MHWSINTLKYIKVNSDGLFKEFFVIIKLLSTQFFFYSYNTYLLLFLAIPRIPANSKNPSLLKSMSKLAEYFLANQITTHNHTYLNTRTSFERIDLRLAKNNNRKTLDRDETSSNSALEYYWTSFTGYGIKVNRCRKLAKIFMVVRDDATIT